MMYLETPPRLIETQSLLRDARRIPPQRRAPTGPTPTGRARRPIASSKARPSTPTGNLYIVDIPFGRIFRIAPDRKWSLVVEYDGWPNGLKIGRHGRILVADYMHGIMELDARAGKMLPVLTARNSESFKGCNDLHHRLERRHLFHRPGPDRPARSDRPGLSPARPAAGSIA